MTSTIEENLVADRHVILEKGHVVWVATSAALAADPVPKDRDLSVKSPKLRRWGRSG